MIDKGCNKCGLVKPLEQFYRNKQAKPDGKNHGRHPWCKSCIDADRKRRRDADPEKRRKYAREYLRANRDRIRAYYRAWYARDKEYFIAKDRNRDARIKAVGGTHTSADISVLMAAQKKKCAVCRESIVKKYHVDHILPIKLGGSNSKANLQLLCPQCNLNKHARHPVDFMRARGFLL